MYRRVVSLILLPCVLLTQSAAALGHTHGGSQPTGHDLRPHFHTNSIPASHEHGHHHHGRDDHHHHDEGDDGDEPDTPEPLSDHDSDAVFIPSVDVVINDRSAVDEELTGSPLWAPVGLNLATALWADPPSVTANWTHPPPPAGCFCALYVRHLALLI